MVLMTPRAWFGRRGRSRHGGPSAAEVAPHRPAADALERFVLDEIGHERPSRGDLIAAVTNRLARREQGIGGGCLDLGVWAGDVWRDQASRTVARLEGDLFDTDALG